MGPTLVAYLHGAGAGLAGTVDKIMVVAAAGMEGTLWLAAMAAVGAAAATTVGRGAAAGAAGSGLGFDPPARGGEEWHTRGLKLCPPRVLTMLGPEKGRRWREWQEEDFFAKKEKGFEMKIKRGGGGGLNRWVRVGERFSPFNVHKWVLKLGLKNLEKLMYCAGNERLQKTNREEGE